MTATGSERGDNARADGLATRLVVRLYPGPRRGDIALPGSPRTTAIESALWLLARPQLARMRTIAPAVTAECIARCDSGTTFK